MCNVDAFNGKKILITGATGLIGSHLAKHILDETNAKIYVMSRSPHKLDTLFEVYDRERCIILSGDVADSIQIDETLDYIFHAAGPIDSETVKKKPLNVIYPNITGLLNCFDLAISSRCKGVNTRMVVFSSATIYGGQPDNEVVFKENESYGHECLDVSQACYTESKRMAEVIAKSMVLQNGLDAVIARFAYVYGDACFKPNTAFYQFIDTLKKSDDIFMRHAGLPRRDNIYIDDAVSGLITVAVNGVSGESYNISSGGWGGNYASIDEIAAEMLAWNKMHGGKSKLSFKEDSQNPKRMSGCILDNSKLRDLGWCPRNNLSLGIKKTLKYYEVI